MERYGVIIVDAHDLVRAGLSLILQATDDLDVLAEASNADDVLPLVAQLGPDVVCLSTRSADADGPARSARLREQLPARTAIVLLGGASETGLAERAERIAADGYASTGWEPERITAAVREAAAAARAR